MGSFFDDLKTFDNGNKIDSLVVNSKLLMNSLSAAESPLCLKSWKTPFVLLKTTSSVCLFCLSIFHRSHENSAVLDTVLVEEHIFVECIKIIA